MATTWDDYLIQQSQEQMILEEKIQDEIGKRLNTLEKTDEPLNIDDKIKEQSADDDHQDRKLDRSLRESWCLKILTITFFYGILNYIIIILYGVGVFRFEDSSVIKIFLGGNVAAMPIMAITITKYLFPQRKQN